MAERECFNQFCRAPLDAKKKKYCSNECYTFVSRLHLPSKAVLTDLYVDQKESMGDIAEYYKVSIQTISNWMDLHKIPRRPLSEAHKAMYAGPRGEKRIQDRLDTLQKNHGTRNPFALVEGGRFKSGMKEDIGVKVRSGWESNVLRWLTYIGVEWQYEVERFTFPVKKGTMSYLPDIYLPNYEGSDRIVEVKGYLGAKDKTRTRRFKKYYPEQFAKMMVIPGNAKQKTALFFEEMGIPVLAYYDDLNRQFKDIIPHWDE